MWCISLKVTIQRCLGWEGFILAAWWRFELFVIYFNVLEQSPNVSSLFDAFWDIWNMFRMNTEWSISFYFCILIRYYYYYYYYYHYYYYYYYYYSLQKKYFQKNSKKSWFFNWYTKSARDKRFCLGSRSYEW